MNSPHWCQTKWFLNYYFFYYLTYLEHVFIYWMNCIKRPLLHMCRTDRAAHTCCHQVLLLSCDWTVVMFRWTDATPPLSPGLSDEHAASRRPLKEPPGDLGGLLSVLHPRCEGGGGVCQTYPRIQLSVPERPGHPAQGRHLRSTTDVTLWSFVLGTETG